MKNSPTKFVIKSSTKEQIIITRFINTKIYYGNSATETVKLKTVQFSF